MTFDKEQRKLRRDVSKLADSYKEILAVVPHPIEYVGEVIRFKMNTCVDYMWQSDYVRKSDAYNDMMVKVKLNRDPTLPLVDALLYTAMLGYSLSGFYDVWGPQIRKLYKKHLLSLK